MWSLTRDLIFESITSLMFFSSGDAVYRLHSKWSTKFQSETKNICCYVDQCTLRVWITNMQKCHVPVPGGTVHTPLEGHARHVCATLHALSLLTRVTHPLLSTWLLPNHHVPCLHHDKPLFSLLWTPQANWHVDIFSFSVADNKKCLEKGRFSHLFFS